MGLKPKTLNAERGIGPRGPELPSRLERRRACSRAIAEQPHCLALVINYAREVGSLEDAEQARRIAARLKENGFDPSAALGIAAIYNGRNGRPKWQFEASVGGLATAFEKTGLTIEVSSFDRTVSSPEGVAPLWIPLEEFALYKVEPGHPKRDVGFIAVTGARNAVQMMGFEPGSPEDRALHPGAVLLSEGIYDIAGEDALTRQAWRQLPLTPATL